MKKVQTKNAGPGYARNKDDLLKPFDFCCDVHHQDPDTRYNQRIPPFVTSLTNIAPNNKEGPDLKFRLQDIEKPTAPIVRSGAHKVKNMTGTVKQMSSGKRGGGGGGGRGEGGGRGGGGGGRGPLQWYVEDEIAVARDIIANEKEAKRKSEKKKRRDVLRGKKNRKRRRPNIPKSNEPENIVIDDDSQKEDIHNQDTDA